MWNRTENKIGLVLVRHGAVEGNTEHRYIGRTDVALSREGRRQLQREKGAYPSAQYLFSSPMRRCVETAEILYPAQRIIQIPEWMEIDFGRFEGKNYQELQSDKEYQAWIDSGGTLPFPEGESREGFTVRCGLGFDRLCSFLQEQKCLEKQGCLSVAVVHGGTIMALLSSFCGGDYFSYQVKNGEGYLCTIESREGKYRITQAKVWKGRENT